MIQHCIVVEYVRLTNNDGHSRDRWLYQYAAISHKRMVQDKFYYIDVSCIAKFGMHTCWHEYYMHSCLVKKLSLHCHRVRVF